MSAIRHLPAALCLAIFAATPLVARSWELLGTRQVSFRAERPIQRLGPPGPAASVVSRGA